MRNLGPALLLALASSASVAASTMAAVGASPVRSGSGVDSLLARRGGAWGRKTAPAPAPEVRLR